MMGPQGFEKHSIVVLCFFYEKQAIRRRQFAAIDCDVFMCGSYQIAGSELPRGLGAYETLCIAKCCKLNIKLTCTYFNPVHGFFTSRAYSFKLTPIGHQIGRNRSCCKQINTMGDKTRFTQF